MRLLAQEFLNSKKNRNLIYLPETQSTSDYLKKEDLPSGTLVITDHQLSGRGRRSNQWFSAPGLNFTGSWSFSLTQAPVPVFPALLGLKLIETCSHFFPKKSWALKAPNDLYLNSAKCAGVLVELINQGEKIKVIIGLGFNVYSSPQGASQLFEDESLSPDAFFNLVTEFGAEIEKLLERTNPELSFDETTRLCEWLNLNSQIPEKIEEISSQGDLIFKSRKISWMEL